jgi:thioredoxin 1
MFPVCGVGVGSRRFGLSAVVAAAVAMACGGCSTSEITKLRTEAEFQEAIQTGRPVLVDFFKAGCATCIPVDSTMQKLALEYKDRATIANFMVMKANFAVPSHEIKTRYDINIFPTVILFRDGVEVHRWVMSNNIASMRLALDEQLALASTQPSTNPAPAAAAPVAPAPHPAPVAPPEVKAVKAPKPAAQPEIP